MIDHARPNEVVAALLQEYADLIAVTGVNRFKLRAYERAARSISIHPVDISTLDSGQLQAIPYVGKSISAMVGEYPRTGRIESLDRLRAQIPRGVRQLAAVPTLGPKKAIIFARELQVSTVDELEAAVLSGGLASVHGFGSKAAQNILHGIEQLRRGGDLMLISTAMRLAQEFIAALTAVTEGVHCEYAGCLRRMCESLDQVDLSDGAGPMVLLHGSELNIGPGGEVDWDADFLASFDICIASVHTQFRQPREQMTSRLIRACRNPYVNVIGHLTTRLIGRRPPIEADFDAVFAAAAATGTALEVNSFPDRLDVNDELILRARRHGVKFAINSDAHSTGQLRLQRYDDVINTWPLPRLRDFLLAKRPG